MPAVRYNEDRTIAQILLSVQLLAVAYFKTELHRLREWRAGSLKSMGSTLTLFGCLSKLLLRNISAQVPIQLSKPRYHAEHLDYPD